MQKTWKGSLIKLKSGKILQSAGVEFNKASPMESVVLFRPGATGATAARHTLKVLLDPATRANVCHSIILGFLGGTFEADGLSVRVTKVKASKGTIESVMFSPLDGSGNALGVSDDTPIEEFIGDFKPTSMTGAKAPGNPVGFDFATYPLMLNVLRTSQVLDPEISELPFQDALRYLAAFNGLPTPADLGVSQADTLAAAAEALMASEKASPELKKLKRVMRSGVLAKTSVEAKAKAARSLAFKSGSAPHTSTEAEKPAKKATPPPKKAKRVRVEEPSEDESDDSDSGSSDESGSDEPHQTPKISDPPKKAAKPYKIPKKSSEPKALIGEEEEVTTSVSLLNSMTPAGMTEVEAAAVIFEAPALRVAADVEIAPADSGISEARLAKRYDLALTHIKRLIPGEAVKWRRPVSRVALELWSETAADMLARPPQAPHHRRRALGAPRRGTSSRRKSRRGPLVQAERRDLHREERSSHLLGHSVEAPRRKRHNH